jgi:RNA 3'-terminal phosphate cyclase (ATP)
VFDGGAEVATAFGERRVRAEAVASQAAEEMKRFLRSDVPVGIHTADQLLVPMALAGGGSFRTLPLTLRTRTNMDVIRAFLPVEIETEREKAGTVLVTLRRLEG